jgi:hypothetical protein
MFNICYIYIAMWATRSIHYIRASVWNYSLYKGVLVICCSVISCLFNSSTLKMKTSCYSEKCWLSIDYAAFYPKRLNWGHTKESGNRNATATSWSHKARAHQGSRQLQRNRNFREKSSISSRQLVSRLAGSHWGNLRLISCSHHLKLVCLSDNFVHFFKSLKHLLSSTISSEPGKDCFAKEQKIMQ